MKLRYFAFIIFLLVIALSVVSLAGCSNQSSTTTNSPATTLAISISTPVQTTAKTSPVASQTVPSTINSPSPQASSKNINVSAAASLTDVIKEINKVYIQGKADMTVTPNFASSGTLQTQIENGAPVDVFISAAASQMDNLQKKDLILTETRRNLLYNKVVLIVPIDSTLALTSFKDLATDQVKKIAIGDPKSVPAGTYAQQAFDLLGITEQVTPKYVIGADVKAVLSYVENGNIDAGIVYSTDALTSSKVKVVASAPAEVNARVVYPVAVIKASKITGVAQDYVNFLFSAQAKTCFEKYGFTLVTQ
jgi:molybdate transport system substrate-binding protein